MKAHVILGMLVVGFASGCGGSDGGGGGGGDGDAQTVQGTLEEQNGSGKTGTAEFHAGAASTDVTIEIEGASDLDPIYVRSGTCESPGTEVVHDVGFTAASLGQGQIFVPIGEVATGEYVLTVEDDKTMESIMCGVIPEN